MPREDTQFKPGNPGRPPGTRNVETLFRDAIAKIAKDQKVEDVERELVITLLAKAKKGDLKALEMYLDRLYGKPKAIIEADIMSTVVTTLAPEKEKALQFLIDKKIGEKKKTQKKS